MDNERQIIISSKSKQIRKKDILEIMELIEKNYNYQNKKLYAFISITILIFLVIIYFIYDNKKELKSQNNIKNYSFQNETIESIMNLRNKINMIETKLINSNINIGNINNNNNPSGTELPEISFEKFDENIYQELKKQQMEFCNDQTKYIKEEFEKQIKLAKVDLLNKSYEMYVYKKEDYVSKIILKDKNWEGKETKLLIDALNYYSSLKNIDNNKIYLYLILE